MNFDLGDLLRSIIIGQSVAMAILSFLYVWLSFKWKSLRPGAITGIILTGISHFCASAFVVIIMADRIAANINVDCRTWLALGYVLAGNFGITLLNAHVVFHSEVLTEKMKAWFGKSLTP